MISLEHAAAKRKRPFSREPRGGGGSSRARGRKRLKPAAARSAGALHEDRALPATVLSSRRESRSVSIRDQAVWFVDGAGDGPEYMQHFSKRRRERRPAARPAPAAPRDTRPMLSGSECDSDGSSAIYSSASRDPDANDSCSDSQSSSDPEARSRDMVCRRRSGAPADAADAADGAFLSARTHSRADALDRMSDVFTAEGETRRLAEQARRLGHPTRASHYDFSDDQDDEDTQSLQLRDRSSSTSDNWFPLAKANQLDHGSLSDGALPLRIESESSSAEEADTVSQMGCMSARGHRRRIRPFLSGGSDSGFEPGGSGSGTADGLCRPVLNLLDSHRSRSNWSGL